MNFELNQDEEMLKALTERFVADKYTHESRRAFLSEPNGYSQSNWELLGELGLIAAPFPEELGGLGLDGTGIATIFEALGHGLVVEPLAQSVVLTGRLFALHASEALRSEWIDALLTGAKRIALAHAEQGGRGRLPWIQTQAKAVSEGFLLSGVKPYCIAGSGADGYIVSARISDPAQGEEGVQLFLVAADTPGLSTRRWTLADGSIAVSVILEDVLVSADHMLVGGLGAIDRAETVAALACSAEALGIMERLFAETLDYLRTRKQFGATLGSFQAIQHRMVAQYQAIEQSRALLNLALVSWNTDGFERAVYGARAYIAEASIHLGHEMIQFHGGMGVTDELIIGSGHKRLLVLSRWPEGPQAALNRYAELLN